MFEENNNSSVFVSTTGSFSELVRKATQEQRKAGNITALQQIRINIASRLPRMSKELESLLVVEFGLEPNAQGLIDWDNFDPDKFLEFVKVIILILQLFGIGV